MKEGLVSIIIPVYNREKTIGDSIKSILEQTYKNFELIIVDDCSTDDSLKKIQEFKDERIKIIMQKKNSGACAARNVGIKNASGEYIAFNDSDDQWRIEKLEKQLKTIKNTGADVVFCQMQRHNYDKETVFPNLEIGFVEYKKLIVESKCSTQTILAKKIVFEEFLFDENLPRFQDFDFVIRSAKKYKYYFLAECLVDVYLQNDSITTKNYEKLYNIASILYEKHRDVCNEYPEFEIFLLKSIGFFKTQKNENAFLEYKRIYELEKNKKNFLKMFFSRIGVLKYFFKNKK